LSFERKRNVHGHLITIKVCVESGADERMNLDGLAFDQHWFERLNTETVQRRRAVQEHRMFANHLLEDVPNDRLLTLDHFARLFDGRGVRLLLELVVDKWLEQLERHLLRKTALMQFQLRPDNYY